MSHIFLGVAALALAEGQMGDAPYDYFEEDEDQIGSSRGALKGALDLDYCDWGQDNTFNRNSNAGTAVNQYACHGGSAQRWRLYRSSSSEANGTGFLIEAPWTGPCIDIPNASQSSGARVQMSRCKSSNRDNQIFTLPVTVFL